MIIVGIIVVLALAIGGWAVGNYNTLVAKRNEVDKQWSQVENNLKRRADLIGNLVGTVKGIAGQEVEVFGKIADARSRLLSAATPEEKIAANDQLTKVTRESGLLPGGGGGILGPGGRFLSLTEAYPAAQIERELHEAAGRARRNRESTRDLAQGLQRRSDGLQYNPTEIPDRSDRRHAGLSGQALVQG